MKMGEKILLCLVLGCFLPFLRIHVIFVSGKRAVSEGVFVVVFMQAVFQRSIMVSPAQTEEVTIAAVFHVFFNYVDILVSTTLSFHEGHFWDRLDCEMDGRISPLIPDPPKVHVL